jgi:hypothetical protein
MWIGADGSKVPKLGDGWLVGGRRHDSAIVDIFLFNKVANLGKIDQKVRVRVMYLEI